MNPDHRFYLLMFALGLIASSFAWALRRIVVKQDARWARVDALILANAEEAGQRPGYIQRMERLETALVNLAATVAELGVVQSRHEGWHERQEELEVIQARRHPHEGH